MDIPFLVMLSNLLAAAVIPAEIGYRVARRKRQRSTEEKPEPVGAVAGGTPGLLAFMLAITFGIAADRFDARRQAMQDEVNAIGTAHLRAIFCRSPGAPGPRSFSSSTPRRACAGPTTTTRIRCRSQQASSTSCGRSAAIAAMKPPNPCESCSSSRP